MNLKLEAQATVQAEWQGVVRMRERMEYLVISTFAFDPIISPIFGNILYNLPLVLAFEVLKQVLLQVRGEEQFTGSETSLANLMDSAKTSLPWIDWGYLREGVERRNELTHEARLLGDEQCLQDVAAIEAQLVAWGVITAA